MKRLIEPKFKYMPFSAHLDFFTKVSTLLSSSDDSFKAAAGDLQTEFYSWLEHEKATMRWLKKNTHNEHIAEAGRQIDRLLRGLNNAVMPAFYSSSLPMRHSAANIEVMLKQRAREMWEPYEEQANNVRSILVLLDGQYAEDAARIGVTYWVIELSAAFELFERLLKQRETEQFERPLYTIRNVRKGIEKVYLQIAEIINMNSVMNASSDFGAFVRQLNPDIERLNTEYAKVRKDLGKGNHTIIKPLSVQKYTGRAITPLPCVSYRQKGKPVIDLEFGEDFSVTYKNNINVGVAELIVHGKDKYKGQKIITFNISI
jgi:hypothetical protein